MSFNFIEYKEKEDLKPIEVKNKEEYIHDLMEIEHSTSGRIDALILNTFILEAIRLVINSIFLFEKGYFDCAYYSLRQSLEVSTTMVYLIELEPGKRETELNNWKKQSKFPMYGEMLKFLKDNGYIFSEMQEKMKDYFFELRLEKEHLNKYVHKQGFNTFYVSRNHMINSNKDSSIILDEFNKYIVICIGAIAILRLTIDPFPILLADEEIYLRTGDLITESYSEKFIEKYIGKKHLVKYKETEVYKSFYKGIMNEEAKLPCVADVVKNQYVNKEKISDILKQRHLLGKMDLIVVLVFYFSNDIAKIYYYDGLGFYFSNIKSVREYYSFNSRVLLEIKKSEKYLNNPYDEAFLTYLKIHEEDFFIEHNKKLSEDEINKMVKSIDNYLNT